MWTRSFIAGVIVTLVAGLSPGDVDYQRMSNFYGDLGCTANSGDEFDCSNVVNADIPGKCVFQGRQFSDGEFLPTDVRLSGCKFGCLCSAPNDTEPGEFNCPEVDCPHYEPLEPGCVRAFSSMDSCCPTQNVCPEDEVNSTCIYEGKTFLEGEIFHPESTRCLMCRCQDSFGLTGEGDGRPKTVSEGGSCQPVPCNIGVIKMAEVNQRCAPIFMSHACCPWEFYCPTGDEAIITSARDKKHAEQQQCRLGSRLLNVGDKIETNDSSLDCFCYMPPFVTCHRTSF